jgi:hypothetical protein
MGFLFVTNAASYPTASPPDKENLLGIANWGFPSMPKTASFSFSLLSVNHYGPHGLDELAMAKNINYGSIR